MKIESSSIDSLSKYVLRIYGGLHLESPGNTRTSEAKMPFSEQETFLEGAVEIYNEKRMQKHSAGLRAKAIEFYKLDCYVCGCNFEEKYGEYGAGYIEIHHLKPLADSKGQRESTVKDVRVVCSNCHSVLHHQGRIPMDIDELRAFVQARSSNQAGAFA
jgi:5-methylcytosine-specific restriction enzyme A